MINNSIKLKDYSKIYSCAHKIKPSFKLFNIDKIFDKTLELEKFAKEESDIDKIIEKYTYINSALIKIFEEMKEDIQILKNQ